MKLQTFIPLTVLLSFSFAAPIIRQQLGIIGSNSNEIVRLPAVTFASAGLGPSQVQGTQFLSPFMYQSTPDFLLPSQVLNFNPQVPALFLPQQQNLSPFLLPTLQQEQPTGPVNPNNHLPKNVDPGLVIPQYFPFPQAPGGQGFPYYMSYGFPSRNTLLRFPPNQNTPNQNPAIQNAANQNPIGPTKVPQPAQNNGKVIEPWRMTPPPDNRGDRPGRGVDGDPAFPYFQPLIRRETHVSE